MRVPEFIPVEEGVAVGRPHKLAVLEMSGRPGWWRVWVDGQAVTDPVRMRGSSGRWAPIATAESWNAGTSACNAFGFRFERVSVSYGGGGSWRPFVPGHQFLDGANVLRDLASAPAQSGVYGRTLASEERPLPYAFVARASTARRSSDLDRRELEAFRAGGPSPSGQACSQARHAGTCDVTADAASEASLA